MKNYIVLIILLVSCQQANESIPQGSHDHPVSRRSAIIDDYPHASTTHVLEDGVYKDAYGVKFIMEEVDRKIFYAYVDRSNVRKIAYVYDEKPEPIILEGKKIEWNQLERINNNYRVFGSIFNRKEVRFHTIIITGDFDDLSIDVFKSNEAEKIKSHFLNSLEGHSLHQGIIHFPDNNDDDD
ncbi:MAG: hypothetical protein RLN88_01155 [Ekhidna sp.]|uniref:hypothetical protein n=1 Tax=Ekhidna sp. TaxID=2608089 RepID=UPI0032ED4074